MILTIANQKGGTAKSTTVAALAQAAAHRGRRCLAIDLDPQGNLSFFLGADANRAGAFDLLEGTPALQLVQATGCGVDVIPASWNLQSLGTSRGSARRLRAALEPIAGSYDLIICDTPPTAGELQYNALMASTNLIIPLQADAVCLQGLYQITDTARQIQQNNPALQVTGYILTRHGGRSTIARQMAEMIQTQAANMGIPFLAAIREAVAIREAQALQRSLYDYAPRSKPAADYLALYDMIDRQ